MNQVDRLRGMDARLQRASVRAGLADAALYRRDGTVIDIPCTVMVDEGLSLQGDLSQVQNNVTTLTAFAADIGSTPPASGDTFTVGARVFTVDGISNKDDSRFVCIVAEFGC